MKRLTMIAAAMLLATAGSAMAWSNNPQPWPNGGGMVYPTTWHLEISESAFIGRGSKVCGSVHISGAARIISSDVTGGAFKGTPVIRNSTIAGNHHGTVIGGNPRILSSYVRGNQGPESYGLIGDLARVVDSRVTENARIWDNADVRNSTVTGSAQVSGSVVVRGSTITRDGAVNCGRWVNITVSTERTGQCGRNGE